MAFNVAAFRWAERNLARYVEKCRALADLPLTRREILAFVLFTPMLRYERSVKCWRHWMQTREVLHDNLWRTREKWIATMPEEYWLRSVLRREPTWGTADLLASLVPGLGWTKAPFYLSLTKPTHERVLVCTDVHVLRALGLDAEKLHGAKRPLQHAQARFQAAARRRDLPSFPLQWAVWDFQRSGGEPVRETNLQEDLRP